MYQEQDMTTVEKFESIKFVRIYFLPEKKYNILFLSALR